jgi:hypothetical protein
MALEVIQLGNYQRPEIKESASKEWVLNGDKNSFYQDIIDAYNGSPTNSAIIDSYSQFIYGKGLTSPQKLLRPSDFAFIQGMISKADLRKVCKDFEMFGEASVEVIYKNGKVDKVVHVAKQRIAPAKANDEGDIDTYFYSYDFSKESKYKPKPFPAYGFGSGANRSEIYVFHDYQVGQFYYANPSWVSAIAWAKLEEEISNYCVNHIKKGLSFGHIINMNSGVQESEEAAQLYAQRIKQKLTGSENAGAFFINFNDNKDTAITIEPLEVSNAHEQYNYLSAEAKHQLMTAHRLTSPLLVGIKEGQGFSSNADEITTAFEELMIHVIQPKQDIILDGLMEIAAVNGISIQLEFIDLRSEEIVEEAGMENDAAISYNGAQISSAIDIFAKVKEGILTKEQAIVFLVQFLNIPANIAKSLFTNEPAPVTELSSDKKKDLVLIATPLIELGEEVDSEEWEEVDSVPLTAEMELNEISLSLAKTFSSFPNAGSEQDTELFKVRYSYAGNPDPEREFCSKLMKAGKVYRKEDIVLAGSKVVNAGFGANGADTYDIFLYKGGVNCKHYWERKIYLRKNNKSISVNEARRMILDLDPADRPKAKWQENPKEVAQVAEASNNYWSLNPNYRK